MKIVYSGLEGSGKSLKLAMVCCELVERNAKWFSETGKRRPIYSNIFFSKEFDEWSKTKEVPIKYWSNLDELILISDADVIIDELGTYFDSRLWADLSLDVRRWLTQGSKSGIEIYGSAQDFAQVDKSFRRLVNELYEIRKLLGSRRPSATKPPVQNIWGICLKFSLNPRSYDEDDKEYADSFILPSFFFIRKKYCEIFDTGQKILRSKPLAMKHVERFCEHHTENGGDGSCQFCKIFHT